MLAVIGLDQLTKQLIVTSIAPWSVGYEFFSGLLRIVCVYNTGAAFSLGHGLSDTMRFIILACIPAGVIAGVCAVYFKSEFTRAQRWFLCGIIGGGISNLLDRFFRTEGVVDFIDVDIPNIAVPGLFSLERWPTFNIADSAIIICAFGLFIAIFMQERKEKQAKKHV